MDKESEGYNLIFIALVNSYNNYDELFKFASQYNLRDDIHVQARLRFLFARDVESMVVEIDEFNDAVSDDPQTKRSKLDKLCNSKQVGGADVDNLSNKAYYIEQRKKRTFKSTQATDTSFKVRFNDDWRGEKLVDISDRLHEMFDDVLSQARTHDADLGRVVIEHPDLSNPIVVPLQPWVNINADTVMNEITKVLNSDENLDVAEDMVVTVGSIDMPKGGVKRPVTQLFGSRNSLQRKRSIFYVENDNNLCLALSVSLCFLKICEKIPVDEWESLTLNDEGSVVDKILKHRKVSQRYYCHILDKNRQKKRTNLAVQLCERAGLPTTRYLGLNDIPRFEELLNVNIFVLSSKVGGKFVRILQNDDRPNLYLYHIDTETEKHWHGIANIQGFFKGAYFCNHCLQPYKSRQKHSCESCCTVCLDQNCKIKDQMSCRSCGRICRSLVCFKRHKQKKTWKKKCYPSQCELFYQCKTCRKVIKYAERQPDEHSCGEWKCPTCSRYHVGEHLCYQRSTPMPEEKKTKKFIFYDFETRQDEQILCTKGYNPSKIRCKNCSKRSTSCESCRTCRNCGNATCGLYQHLVNFAVLQTSCDFCQDTELTPDSKCSNCGRRCPYCDRKDKTGEFECMPCPDTCGHRETVFKGDGAVSQFCNYITQEHCANFILLAHNAKSFDLYPVLETLIERHAIKPDRIIYNGSKIMYMHVGNQLNLTFIDSLNFIPEPLARLPKLFELEELCKGFFPHTFNTKSNQTYSGCFPSPEHYGYNTMSKDRREEFLKWYKDRENDVFDFQDEILKYCRSDVDILRRACIKFRDLMKSVTEGIDPFDYVTIASVCMGIFKTLFLREEQEREIKNLETSSSSWYPITYINETEYLEMENDTVTLEELSKNEIFEIGEKRFRKSSIAAITSNGYGTKENYSKSSIQWLEWTMEKSRRDGSDLKLQHALNGGEFKIPGTNYRCDGFDQSKNMIYEFYGCTFHGCPKCYPHDRSAVINPTTKQSMEELYTMTMKREAHLRSLGYKIYTKWEHEFHFEKRKNQNMLDFLEHLDIQDRLNPRDSFFGGRTNATKLHYAATKDETIQYYDFTSLYPWTNKYCRYPCSSHPTIITDNFSNIKDYFGLAKIKVLPPRGLYHPVLPYTSNGKLKFPLCRTCSDRENKTACVCTDDDRCIVGTWCTPEIQKALEKGYTILKIYEVYHFEESTEYDHETGKGGLFSDYVNMFLKIKQEASGFPSECKSEEDKWDYIRQYKKKEGIELDYEKIKVNQGLRNLAKLCLNSFWGKFGQRLQLKQSQFIHESEVETLFQMLTDPRKEVYNFHIVTKDILQLEWKHDPLFLPFDMKTNIFLASFTTMWARLRLYSVLEILDKDVLYYDTDSVIFRAEANDSLEKLPIGNYLGELTNEIDSKDGYIVEFVSGGPKNYAYRTLSGKERCKVRGFTLNWTNSKLINFSTVKSMICDDNVNEITVTNPCKISRDARKRKLYNRVENKKYKIVYTKRRILENLDTEPYGY